MGLDMWGPYTQVFLLLMFTVGGALLGRIVGSAARVERTKRLEHALAALEHKAAHQKEASEMLWERCSRAEESVKELQLSIVRIPEVAQRLSGARDLREIPELALDLVQEIFAPAYSVFYRVHRGQLVAVGTRGESEFHVGHRLAAGEGIVGWTAAKQMSMTAEDADLESALVKQRNLERCLPVQGFSLCVPIVGGDHTLGVILVGPTSHRLPHANEVGRTIALMTAITITSTIVLKKEQALATTDGLTGLLNKTSIYDKLAELMTSGGPPPTVSIFLLDIDFFKNYNDTNGHLPGDKLLKQMGKLLLENSRETECVGRYGGEEFLLVMKGCSKKEALQAAERIRSLVEGALFEYRESQPGGAVTISGGVATWPGDGADVDALVSSADQALYEAKRAGRNRVYACSDAPLEGDAAPIMLIHEEEEKPE